MTVFELYRLIRFHELSLFEPIPASPIIFSVKVDTEPKEVLFASKLLI
jgi:hypothetical protein